MECGLIAPAERRGNDREGATCRVNDDLDGGRPIQTEARVRCRASRRRRDSRAGKSDDRIRRRGVQLELPRSSGQLEARRARDGAGLERGGEPAHRVRSRDPIRCKEETGNIDALGAALNTEWAPFAPEPELADDGGAG